MSTTPHSDRFSATRVGSIEWQIEDAAHPPRDPRRVVAHVWHIDDDEWEVAWTRDLALSTRYPSIRALLEDLGRVGSRRTKPTPIAHRPPLAAAG